MADTSLFGRLKRLFSSDVIIRNVGGDQLKVIDTDRIQSLGALQTNALVDRFTKYIQRQAQEFTTLITF